MIKKLVSISFGLILVAASQVVCSKASGPEEAAEKTVVAGREEASDPRLPAGQGRGLGRGRQVPPGRGLGRLLKNSVLLELTADEAQALELKTVPAGRRAMRNQLRAMGKVLVPQTKKAIVSYAFPARVSDVQANIGDWVAPGQKLVTLQSEEVGKARADFSKAQADFELARRNLEREKNLVDRGVGARKNLLTTEAEFKVAEAGLNASEKKLHVLGFTEEMVQHLETSHEVNPVISLQAPIGGKVIASQAVRGAMVDQNTEILVIMDPTVLWIEAEIYERDIAKIKTGQDVEVSVPAYPGEVFPGKISYIGDVLKEDSRTITVRTEIRNRDYKLKPGMTANVSITTATKSGVLRIPNAALRIRMPEKGPAAGPKGAGAAAGPVVWILAGKKPERTRITAGISDGSFTEVVSGELKEGQDIIVEVTGIEKKTEAPPSPRFFR